MARYRKLGHRAVHGDAADAVAARFGEPQRAVAHRDRQRFGARRDAVAIFGDAAVRRDFRDAVGVALGEPDIAVRAEDHAVGADARGKREFRDVAARREAADLVSGFFGEPQIAVAAERDADRRRIFGRHGKFRERAAVGIEATDLRRAALGEPQRAVRPLDRDIGLAVSGGNFVRADGDASGLPRRCANRSRCANRR